MVSIKKIAILTIVFILSAIVSKANIRDTAIIDTTLDPLVELMKIQSSYYNPLDTAFQVDFFYYLEDHDTTVVRDTIPGYLQTQGLDHYVFDLGSTLLQVQTSTYLMTVYYEDSLIVLNKPISKDRMLFQIDLLDTLLYPKQINNITVKDSGLYREIHFDFANESPYLSYDIVYDTVAYELKFTNYKYKKEVVAPGTGSYTPSHYVSISMFYTKHNFPPGLGTIEFTLDYYFTVQKGVFTPLSPFFTNWTIINNSQQ